MCTAAARVRGGRKCRSEVWRPVGSGLLWLSLISSDVSFTAAANALSLSPLSPILSLSLSDHICLKSFHLKRLTKALCVCVRAHVHLLEGQTDRQMEKSGVCPNLINIM